MPTSEFSGFLGGALASSIFYPLDILKYRSQAGDSNITFKKLWFSGRNIYQQHGIRGLYSGASVNIAANMVAWGCYFPIYERLLEISGGNNNSDSKFTYLACGYLAGVPVLLATNPLWVIKTQMALNYNNNLQNLRLTIRNIIKKDGYLRGFYRGLIPGLINCMHGGVHMFCYELMKNLDHRYNQSYINHRDPTWFDKALSGFILGTMAKSIAVAVMYPVSTIRIRMEDQNRNYNRKMVNVLSSIRSEYGLVRGLFRGLWIQLILKSPAVGLIFAIYEGFK